MRISDWSSDVCSSDLGDIGELQSVATASRGEVGDHVIALIAGQREAENVSAAAAGQGVVAVAAGQRVALIGAGEVVVAGGPGDAAAGLVFILGIAVLLQPLRDPLLRTGIEFRVRGGGTRRDRKR